MNNRTRKIVIAALLATLCCIATMIIKIPSPLKGCMAVAAFYVFKVMHKTLGNLGSRIISGIIAEVIMILGYYIFEGFMYGFIPSAVNIPAHSVQGIAGLIIGVILIKVMEKRKITIE